MSKLKLFCVKVLPYLFGLILACLLMLLGVYGAFAAYDRFESAYAAEDEGQVYNFNQLIKNGDFSNGANFWLTNRCNLVVTDYATVNFTGSTGQTYALYQSGSFPVGHTFACISHVSMNVGTLYARFTYTNNTDVTVRISATSGVFFTLLSPTSTTVNFALVSNNQDSFSVYTCMLIDLTLLGREDITTLEDWRLVFPSEYYDYTTGTLISTSYESGVFYGKTIGYNEALSLLGGSYTTSSNDFLNGYSVYVRSNAGYYGFTLGMATANRLTTGYSDWFPDVTYDQIKSLGLKCFFFADFGSVKSTDNNGNNSSLVANSYTLIEKSLYFSSYDTQFVPLSFEGSTYDAIEIFIRPPESYIPGLNQDCILCFIITPHFTIVNYKLFSTNTLVDGTYTQYVLSFAPYNSSSYEFNFVLNSTEAQTSFNLGVQTANQTLNRSSVSYLKGFEDGRNAPTYTFSDVISSAIDVPVSTFISLFNFDFLGINLKDFLLSLLTLGIIVAIVRLLLGGK